MNIPDEQHLKALAELKPSPRMSEMNTLAMLARAIIELRAAVARAENPYPR